MTFLYTTDILTTKTTYLFPERVKIEVRRGFLASSCSRFISAASHLTQSVKFIDTRLTASYNYTNLLNNKYNKYK